MPRKINRRKRFIKRKSQNFKKKLTIRETVIINVKYILKYRHFIIFLIPIMYDFYNSYKKDK